MRQELLTRLADAAAAGQRVIYFGPNRLAGRHALMTVDDELTLRGVGCQLRRTNGHERLTTETGGSMVIASRVDDVRGRVADLVVLDCWAGPELIQYLRICLATTGGELIYR